MKNLLTTLAPYNKAFVPVAVAAVLALLAQLGLTGDMTVKDAVTYVVTSGLVFLVPNLNKGKK